MGWGCLWYPTGNLKSDTMCRFGWLISASRWWIAGGAERLSAKSILWRQIALFCSSLAGTPTAQALLYRLA